MNFSKPHNLQHRQQGFTIVELLLVIVVIGILAAITVVAYKGVQQRAKVSVMSSDLSSAARAFELYKFDNGSYPTDMPANIKTSKGVVLSATNTTGDTFCINAYYPSDPSVLVSWDSKNGLQQGTLCDGAAIGGPAGGSVPLAARGTNLMPDFSHWTLTGTATYNTSTGELTLGTSGSARSPLVRVDHPVGIKTGGDMYATTASPNSGLAPQGGYHVSIYYYGSDGTTPAQNTGGYTGNGCAKAIALNTWVIATQGCAFSGGPNVIYTAYTFWSSASGYTSPDLKIKNPLLIIND
jgi:prepilin-type N-terminal cleavage/methylation domain-containing protein